MNIRNLTQVIRDCSESDLCYGTIRTLLLIDKESDRLERENAELKAELIENAESCSNSNLELGWCLSCTSRRWCKSGTALVDAQKGKE